MDQYNSNMQSALDEAEKVSAEQTQDSSLCLKTRLNRIASVESNFRNRIELIEFRRFQLYQLQHQSWIRWMKYLQRLKTSRALQQQPPPVTRLQIPRHHRTAAFANRMEPNWNRLNRIETKSIELKLTEIQRNRIRTLARCRLSWRALVLCFLQRTASNWNN